MNAAEISRIAADSAAEIAAHLLPNGKKVSGEWKVGGVDGSEGQSLAVRISGAKRGVWKDFATDQSGDLIDLWAAVRNQTLAEAITDMKDYLGIRDTIKRQERTFTRPDKSLYRKPKQSVMDWLKARGLTEDTLNVYRVAEQSMAGKTYAVFPYLRGDELINVKARNIADKHDMRQSAGAEPCLYGWHLIDPRCREVVICEGEIDAMTWHQMGFAALSVNAGAGNHQWIESDWDRLNVFSTIFLSYDADEAGRKGASEVANRLGNERCRMVQLGAKDANDWLKSGAERADFDEAIIAAKTLDPQELRTISSYMADVKALFYPTHDEPPVRLRIGNTSLDWFEFRTSELTVWTGYNGHGKSLMLNQILLGLVEQGQKVCVFSGEMTPAQQGKRLVKQAGALDKPTPEYIDAIGRWIEESMWIFAVTGSATIDRLLEVFAYGNRRYGITHFVIDSLMMTDVPEDGPGAHSKQKEAIQKLANFAKSKQVHVHLVAHPRKGKDETAAPGKLDVAGSSKITDGADNVFSVFRLNKDESDPADSEKPDAYLELQKQRNGDVQNRRQWLDFDNASKQYIVGKRNHPHTYVRFSKHERVE